MNDETIPALGQPENDHVCLWRYMNFEHYVSMLVNGGLWFSYIAELAEQDPYEWHHIAQLRSEFARLSNTVSGPEFDAALFGEDEQARAQFLGTFEEIEGLVEKLISDLDETVYVNCWHLNEVESAGMWHLYANRSAGIAIKCRFAQLRSQLDDEFSVGLVEYIAESDFANEWGGINTYMRKRKSFAHEREVRALTPLKTESERRPNRGFWQSVNLNDLIDEIVVGPTTEKWLQDVVENVARKYGLKVPIVRSNLLEDPFPAKAK